MIEFQKTLGVLKHSPTIDFLRRTALAFLILLGALVPDANLRAQEQPAASPEKPPTENQAEYAFDREQYLQAYDQVWDTINKTHWDPKLLESKWIPAREKYRQEMESASSREQAIGVLEKLIAELGQSHFEIIPASSYAAIDKLVDRGGSGWSGLTVRGIKEQLVVTAVAPDSPAARGGIAVGWVLEQVKVEGKELKVTAAEVRKNAFESAEHDVMREDTRLGLLGTAITSSEIGDRLELTMRDNADESRIVELELVKGPGEPTKFGNLPTIYVEFLYRQLPDQVGYIRFNAFLDPVRLIKQYQEALLNPHNARGVVIDLRGNLGGAVFLAMGMGGWFVTEPHSLGKMLMKNTPLNLKLNPRLPHFGKPVAILVDECSISCAELFPGGLQELGAARVFGSRTAGLVIPSTVVKLPTGDGFQYAVAGLESVSGYSWEGNGVQPDEPVVLTRELLQKDQDPVLSAALRWLAEQAVK